MSKYCFTIVRGHLRPVPAVRPFGADCIPTHWPTDGPATILRVGSLRPEVAQPPWNGRRERIQGGLAQPVPASVSVLVPDLPKGR